MRLDNKRGIITAAASGMGRAGARLFAAEGAKLVLIDRDIESLKSLEDEIQRVGGAVQIYSGDLTNSSFVESIVSHCTKALGGLDFVWNHAGSPGPAEVENLDIEDYDLAVSINLTSGVIISANAVKEFKRSGGGNILFTSSVSGLLGSPRSPVYGMVKFGVLGFARSLAKRYAKENIRVNAICPGGVETPMLREFIVRRDDYERQRMDPNQLYEIALEQYPMGRPALPEEVAKAALFLISDDASYISGVCLPVDGAFSA